jgi:hypothetical protein
METASSRYAAECFWPDVRERDLHELDGRILTAVAELGTGSGVRYLGSILIRDDEVLLCQFEGPAGAVRAAATRAAVPFERLLEIAVAAPTTREEAQ